ncbi:outer membrane protein transport protein [Pseudomonas protegens]|uniref:outer membrane protein transport protein n=1 Tax=Pseudomonas protegens TaxID=380021 RepID=UPI0031586BB6
MKIHWPKSLLTIAIYSNCLAAFANGLAINEQSSSSAGTAYAGRSSSVNDASTIYGNPAGLTKLKRAEISGGVAVFSAKDDLSKTSGGSPGGTNKGDSIPIGAIPFGFLSTPINDRLSTGIGVYVPFGLINDYEGSFAGRGLGSYSNVQVVTVQPTIAYRISDNVSVGFGPTINHGKGKLENDLNTGGLPPVLGGTGRDTRVSIKGDDTALGYNLGVMIDIDKDTTWGLTYHSKVDLHMEGNTSISNAPNTPLSIITGTPTPGTLAQALNGEYSAKLDVTLPESIDTSITHKFDDQWTMYAGLLWTRWSRIKSLNVKNSGLSAPAEAMFGEISETMDWKDTVAASIGAAYKLTDSLVLRSGFAYDPSPAGNDNRSVRAPVGNRKTITFGAGYSPTPDMTFDVAYAYLWESTASVNQSGRNITTGSGLSLPIVPAYKAKYDNSAHGLTAQLTYRF